MSSITVSAVVGIVFKYLKRITLQFPVTDGHAFGDNPFPCYIMRYQR